MSSSGNNNSGSATGGIGFCGLLAIVFIVLKLLGKIEWGWLWVLAPIWIPIAIVIVVLIIILVVTVLKNKRRKRNYEQRNKHL